MAKKGVLGLGRQFFSTVVPGVIKPVRTLWNEVIGFLFIAFAVIVVFRMIPMIRSFDGGPKSVFEVAIAGIFVLVMTGYGISSFLRARRIARS